MQEEAPTDKRLNAIEDMLSRSLRDLHTMRTAVANGASVDEITLRGIEGDVLSAHNTLSLWVVRREWDLPEVQDE